MPFSGGISDKVGGRFEALWTVWQFVSVIGKRAESVYLEPAGSEGDGVEFRVTTAAGWQYHQVKRQRTGHGLWTLASLHRSGVLTSMKDKLQAEDASFFFVSTEPSPQLTELVERAKTTPDGECFFAHAPTSDFTADALVELVRYWDGWSHDEIWAALRRVEVVVIAESALRDQVAVMMEAHVTGNVDNAIDVLAQLTLARVGNQLDATAIWKHLTDRQFGRQDWAADATILDTIDALTNMYVKRVEATHIEGLGYSCDEQEELLGLLLNENAKTSLAFVTGEGGSGSARASFSHCLSSRREGTSTSAGCPSSSQRRMARRAATVFPVPVACWRMPRRACISQESIACSWNGKGVWRPLRAARACLFRTSSALPSFTPHSRWRTASDTSMVVREGSRPSHRESK